jgi:GxxExxY protein
MPKRLSRKPKRNLLHTLLAHAGQVMSILGKGHTERVYHRAMITALNRAGTRFRSEVLSPIYFMGDVVGFGRCDLVIGDLVVEFKANRLPPKRASSQLQKYLDSAGPGSKGVILNFNQRTGRIDVHKPKQTSKRTKASR